MSRTLAKEKVMFYLAIKNVAKETKLKIEGMYITETIVCDEVSTLSEEDMILKTNCLRKLRAKVNNVINEYAYSEEYTEKEELAYEELYVINSVLTLIHGEKKARRLALLKNKEELLCI